MAERGWVPANDAAEMVADAEERAILQILDGANDKELPQLIIFMTSRSMLTASIVMRAACLGHMRLVEAAMAHLANAPLARVAADSTQRHPPQNRDRRIRSPQERSAAKACQEEDTCGDPSIAPGGSGKRIPNARSRREPLNHGRATFLPNETRLMSLRWLISIR